ncbi:MAG TPA: phosphoribosyltransferase [Chloroflexota bacterium]|nr:phosphoribosyltransferase [Chloroflexota bacterium]
MPLFEDRSDAGRRLAAELEEYRGKDALVLALPRGGVEVGYEIATALSLPLDVFVAKKLGAPGEPELAIGAVAENGGEWDHKDTVALLGVTDEYLKQEIATQTREMERRVRVYRGGTPLPALAGKTVLLVDDGIATGYTILAALSGLRAANPGNLVAAVPMAAEESLWRVSRESDRVVCLVTPEPFYAVGYHYAEFGQLTDEDVVRYLERARQELSASRGQTRGS